MRVRKGLACLGQAFLGADQPGVAEQKNELGGGAQAAGKWQRIPSSGGRPLALLNSHGHWEFLSERWDYAHSLGLACVENAFP